MGGSGDRERERAPLACLLLSLEPESEAAVFIIHQGFEIGRRSLLRVEARCGQKGIVATLYGACVPVMQGKITLRRISLPPPKPSRFPRIVPSAPIRMLSGRQSAVPVGSIELDYAEMALWQAASDRHVAPPPNISEVLKIADSRSVGSSRRWCS